MPSKAEHTPGSSLHSLLNGTPTAMDCTRRLNLHSGPLRAAHATYYTMDHLAQHSYLNRLGNWNRGTPFATTPATAWHSNPLQAAHSAPLANQVQAGSTVQHGWNDTLHRHNPEPERYKARLFGNPEGGEPNGLATDLPIILALQDHGPVSDTFAERLHRALGSSTDWHSPTASQKAADHR